MKVYLCDRCLKQVFSLRLTPNNKYLLCRDCFALWKPGMEIDVTPHTVSVQIQDAESGPAGEDADQTPKTSNAPVQVRTIRNG